MGGPIPLGRPQRAAPGAVYTGLSVPVTEQVSGPASESQGPKQMLQKRKEGFGTTAIKLILEFGGGVGRSKEQGRRK